MNKKNFVTLYEFDAKKYKFRELVEGLFGCEPLEDLHVVREDLIPDDEYNHRPWPLNEGKSDFDNTFYERLRRPWVEFIDLYEEFVYEYIPEIVGEKFIFQKTPNFRIHIPNQKAVTKWHFDADKDHMHPVGEINFIIPVTKMFDTSTVWVESEMGKADYGPINFEQGQFCKFNGNLCAHGNKTNMTHETRVSFDFRVLPMSCYPPKGLDPNNFGESVWMNTKYDIGGYYKEMER